MAPISALVMMMIPNQPPALREILSMLWERSAIAALSEPLHTHTWPPSRDPYYRPFRRDAERLFDARTASSANALFVWRHSHSALNRWWLVIKEVEKLYRMPIKETWNAGKSIEAEIRDLSQRDPENDQALVSLVWAVVASLPSGSPLEEALPHLLSALAFARAGSYEESRHNLLKTVAILSALEPADLWREATLIAAYISAPNNDEAQEVAMFWAAVASCLAEKAHDLRSPKLHHAFAWKEAGRWDKVRESLGAEAGARWPPEWLILHGEACFLTKDDAAARRDVAILCWHHPEDAERAFAADRFPSIQLIALWQEFSDTELETEDFPSWFLLQAPGDAVEPDVAPHSPTGDAYRILNSLQRSSKPDVQLRIKLKAARPKLFEAYMRSV